MKINGKDILDLLSDGDCNEVIIHNIFPASPDSNESDFTIRTRIRLADEEMKERFEDK